MSNNKGYTRKRNIRNIKNIRNLTNIKYRNTQTPNNNNKYKTKNMKGVRLSNNMGNNVGNQVGNNVGNQNSINNANRISNLLSRNNNGEYVYKYYKAEDDSTVKKNTKRCMCINYKSMDDFNTYDRCPNTVLPNTDFCQLHQNCKSYLRQFLSGSEPESDQSLWQDPLVEGSHNCYSYFLNRQVRAVKEKCNEICEKKHKTGSTGKFSSE
jgi:hypothetical protein